MRLFFITFFNIFHLLAFIRCANWTIPNIIIMLVVVALSINFFNSTKNVKDNFVKLYVIIYFFFCHSMVMSFPDYFKVEDYYRNSLWLFTEPFYIIIFAVTALLSRRKISYKRYIEKPVSNSSWRTLIIVMFIFSFVSYALGLQKMGSAESSKVVLPFKLAGIIYYSRATIFPVLYAFFMVRSYKKMGKDTLLNYLFILLLWGIVETFVRLSRSALIYTMLPLLITMLISNTLTVKKMIRLSMPVVILAFIFFPIVTILRGTTGDEKVQFEDITEAANERTDNEEIFRTAYLRTFSTANFYKKTYNFVEDDIFDFSRAPLIVSLGGTHMFMTYFVDETERGRAHNSGSTGIIDSLMFGGYGFCYIIFVFTVLLAVFLDKEYFINRPFLRYMGYSWLYWIVQFRTISLFLDTGSYSQFIVMGALTFYFYRHYKQERYFIPITK